MRALVCFALLLGGIFLLAGGESAAQEKKEPKKVPLKEPYTEYVSVKRYLGKKGAEFVKPQDDVPAYRETDKSGKQYIIVEGAGKGGVAGGPPPVKSEIIDKDGTVWTVTRTSTLVRSAYHLIVEKKPAKE